MENAISILKEIQNKLTNNSTQDDQNIGFDINKVIQIISS